MHVWSKCILAAAALHKIFTVNVKNITATILAGGKNLVDVRSLPAD